MIGTLLVAGMLASATNAHCPEPIGARTIEFDRSDAAAGFRVRAGAIPLRGSFQRLRGHLRVGSERACVRAELDATSVVMGNEAFGKWARSPDFFDAARHPRLEFRSRPFDPRALLEGGVVDGTLTLRGTSHRQRLRADPARCAAKRATCTVRLRGAMLRSTFGMRARRPFVSDRVDLELRFDAPLGELGLADAAPGR